MRRSLPALSARSVQTADSTRKSNPSAIGSISAPLMTSMLSFLPSLSKPHGNRQNHEREQKSFGQSPGGLESFHWLPNGAATRGSGRLHLVVDFAKARFKSGRAMADDSRGLNKLARSMPAFGALNARTNLMT
jgi:hypothetical protein